METMSYNKVNKKKSNYGIYGFFTFIILGTGIIVYSLINEPSPVILGKNPLKDVEIYHEEASSKNVTSNIEYTVSDSASSEKGDKFKTNIVLPSISINGKEMTEINSEIAEYFNDRAASLKEQMSGKVENSFTYKVTYKVYENNIDGNKIVSITVHERIVDDAAGSTTTDRVNGYNIDLAKEKLLSQEEAALEILGSNYNSLIKEQIKGTVVGSKMLEESKYNYTTTGLEQFYIKEGKIHILLNENEVVDKAYGVVDIEITK